MKVGWVLFFFSFTAPGCMWNLVSWSRIKLGPPASGVQSLNHWTARVPHLASVRVLVRRTVIPVVADLQFPWLNRTRIHFQAHPVIIGRAQCPDSWMDWGPQTLASGPLQRALPAWQLASLGSEGKREVTSHHFCHTLFIRRLGLTHTQGGEGEGIT